MAEPQNFLLGLDAGNTVIKAVLFDSTGKQLAASRREGRSLSPAPGYVERDMEELWANAALVISECLDRAGADPRRVAAVGCAGHGNGLYLLDKTGGPLLAIQSLDSRAAALAEELGGDGNGARLHAICLQAPWPSQTPTLLAWVKRNAPEAYARAGTAFLCKDFVTWRLTGAPRLGNLRPDRRGHAADARVPLRRRTAGGLWPRRCASSAARVRHADRRGRAGHRRGSRGDRAGGRHTGRRRPVRRGGERAGLGRGRTRDRPRSSSARGASTRSSRARRSRTRASS